MEPTTRPAPPTDAALARLAGILDVAEDAIISVDLRQRVVLFNGGAERVFGYAAAEVLGQDLNVLLPERFAADHPAHVEAFARSGVGSRRMADRREVLGRRKDGSEFPAEVSISCFVHDGETILTAILRDVTARKRSEEEIHRLNAELEQRVRDRTAELEEALASLRTRTEEIQAMTQQLWHAAKLASVGELAASIAHELNNPLATVTLRIEAVLAQTPDGDPRRRALVIIEQETRRMADLVANLLQFSRRSGDSISTVDIRDELAKALDLVHHHLRKRAIAVGRDLADGTPPIHADRQKLRQVFLNLLTNACDAMPQGGTLTLRAGPATLADGRAAVAIEFIDSGVGIAAEHLDKVLEPFFTTKAEGKGTGLGLAICRRVVHEHQGTLHIASEVGRGTTVRIVLPLSAATNAGPLRAAGR